MMIWIINIWAYIWARVSLLEPLLDVEVRKCPTWWRGGISLHLLPNVGDESRQMDGEIYAFAPLFLIITSLWKAPSFRHLYIWWFSFSQYYRGGFFGSWKMMLCFRLNKYVLEQCTVTRSQTLSFKCELLVLYLSSILDYFKLSLQLLNHHFP